MRRASVRRVVCVRVFVVPARSVAIGFEGGLGALRLAGWLVMGLGVPIKGGRLGRGRLGRGWMSFGLLGFRWLK